MQIGVQSGSTYIDLSQDLVSMKVDDEIIWSSNTGRSTTGKMIGTVIAEKKTIDLTWGVLEETFVKKIKKYLCAGFFPIRIHDAGEDVDIKVYRGTLSKEHLGYIGDGKYYYKSATVNIVQQ